MKEKMLVAICLWTRHRGEAGRLAIAKRLEEMARSLRDDMHSGTFNETSTGAGAVFIMSEHVDEVNES